MTGGKLTTLVFFLVLAPSVLADHNAFDTRVDLNTINWFDRGLYFNSLPYQGCIDMHEFNQYADSDRSDRWDRDDLYRYTGKLDWQDLQRLADQKQGDRWDGDEFQDRNDFKCTNQKNFNKFAKEDDADQWDQDDYFGFIGYPNEQQFTVRTRHFPYEYTRIRRARYGGFTSRYPFTY